MPAKLNYTTAKRDVDCQGTVFLNGPVLRTTSVQLKKGRGMDNFAVALVTEDISKNIHLWRPRHVLTKTQVTAEASILKLSQNELLALARFLSFRDLLALRCIGCPQLWANLSNIVTTASHEPIGWNCLFMLDVIPKDPFLLLATLPKLHTVHLPRITLRSHCWKTSPLALLPRTLVHLELGFFESFSFKVDHYERVLLDFNFSQAFPRLETLMIERNHLLDEYPNEEWLLSLPPTITSLHLQNVCDRLTVLAYIQSKPMATLPILEETDQGAHLPLEFRLPSLAYLSLVDKSVTPPPLLKFLPSGIVNLCWVPATSSQGWSLFQHVYPLLPSHNPAQNLSSQSSQSLQHPMTVQLLTSSTSADWVDSNPSPISSLTFTEYLPLPSFTVPTGLKELCITPTVDSFTVIRNLARSGVALTSLSIGSLTNVGLDRDAIRSVFASLRHLSSEMIGNQVLELLPPTLKSLSSNRFVGELTPDLIALLPKGLEKFESESCAIAIEHLSLLPRSLLFLSFSTLGNYTAPTHLPPNGPFAPVSLEDPDLGVILYGLPPKLETLFVANCVLSYPAHFHPQLGSFLPRSLRLFIAFNRSAIQIKPRSFFQNLLGSGPTDEESIRLAQSLFPANCATNLTFRISSTEFRTAPWRENGIVAVEY